MIAVKTSLTAGDLPDHLLGIRSAIESAVPHGRTDDGGRNDKGRHQGALPESASRHFMGLSDGLQKIVAEHPKLEKNAAPIR